MASVAAAAGPELQAHTCRLGVGPEPRHGTKDPKGSAAPGHTCLQEGGSGSSSDERLRGGGGGLLGLGFGRRMGTAHVWEAAGCLVCGLLGLAVCVAFAGAGERVGVWVLLRAVGVAFAGVCGCGACRCVWVCARVLWVAAAVPWGKRCTALLSCSLPG